MPEPPLPLVGVAHGSLGVGALVAEALGVALSDDVGTGPLASWFAAAVGLVLPIGRGNEDELGVAAADGVLDEDGDALASTPHSALDTGSVDGDALDVGVALPDGSAIGEGLPDGRSDGLGPLPPSANAVAATDAKIAAVAAPRASERRVISVHLRTDLPPRVHATETVARPITAQKVRCS